MLTLSHGGCVSPPRRLIYNDLQGRNQKNVVQHIAEEGLRARRAWSTRVRVSAPDRNHPVPGAFTAPILGAMLNLTASSDPPDPEVRKIGPQSCRLLIVLGRADCQTQSVAKDPLCRLQPNSLASSAAPTWMYKYLASGSMMEAHHVHGPLRIPSATRSKKAVGAEILRRGGWSDIHSAFIYIRSTLFAGAHTGP